MVDTSHTQTHKASLIGFDRDWLLGIMKKEIKLEQNKKLASNKKSDSGLSIDRKEENGNGIRGETGKVLRQCAID